MVKKLALVAARARFSAETLGASSRAVNGFMDM